jgi:MoxR-like ATPase
MDIQFKAPGPDTKPAEGTTPYLFNPDIELAVNVALVADRPLLVRGEPGCGKSTLARSVASVLGWRYFSEVVTSRTQAQDLLWKYDALARLRDAQVNQLKKPEEYVQRGVFWHAFAEKGPSIVLVDEIDKADPDVPNDLLLPLGEMRFVVHETGEAVTPEARAPLVFITTNEERSLPQAFLRRCIVLTLEAPSRQRLVDIAVAHFGTDDKQLYDAVAGKLETIASAARERAQRIPSTAEYLDAVRACKKLQKSSGDAFDRILGMTLQKERVETMS